MGTIMWKSVEFVHGAFQRLFKLLAMFIFITFPSVIAAEPVIIAALGDSLTQGFGLPAKDGLVPQLESWLKQQGEDVRIINAGVSGDTTAGGLARIGWTLTPDVQTLIVILGGNDILRGVDPANSRANIAAILDFATTRNLPVLLVGMPAPRNYGPKYKAQYDALYPELAEEYEILFVADFFAAIQEGETKIPAPKFMQADGVHPNADGVKRIVAAIGPKVQSLILLTRKR